MNKSCALTVRTDYTVEDEGMVGQLFDRCYVTYVVGASALDTSVATSTNVTSAFVRNRRYSKLIETFKHAYTSATTNLRTF